jgi:peptidoglycan-associated lipoprotein
MKRAALLHFFIVGVALSLTAVGCKRGPKPLTPIPGSGGSIGNPNQTPMIGDVGPITDGSLVDSGEGIPQPPRPGPDTNYDYSRFAAETVYFDLDSSVLKPGEVAKVETVVSYLASNPSHAVLIEGHCDERGTEEYNRALGERRALSVREAMVRMGADASRVYTLSHGEDQPANPGQNETAWSQNRRGVFALMTP